jgi:predicted RecB family nuclease
MLINEELFAAFVNCETKSFLKVTGTKGDRPEFLDWQRRILNDYKQKCCLRLQVNCHKNEYFLGSLSLENLRNNRYRFVIDCIMQAEGIQSSIHALERLASASTKHDRYIPIRFVPSRKITRHDKLLLAFDALVISMASGETPPFGRIIHGGEQKVVKIGLSGLMKPARAIVESIAAQLSSQTPPQLILNKHCVECEFQQRCRQIAIEKDELSLLSRMTEKERKKQHAKGILSVTQLSYTFRPRRKPKRLAGQPEKHNNALQALAIRERKIHIVGKPELKLVGGASVSMDVEGIPDRDFYYLIGLRISGGGPVVQRSYWANEPREEKEIWMSCLRMLGTIESPQLIHYGSYETIFLKRMNERYGSTDENRAFINELIANSVNLLSVIYGHIYFPTYSNGLKEISKYLGFAWSDNTASGLQSLSWRSQWEFSKDAGIKEKLITYNAEDCEALERVTNTIVGLYDRSESDKALHSGDATVVNTDSIKREYPQRFGTIDFAIPELAAINKAAYWDYQHNKIYVRSSARLNRAVKRNSNTSGRVSRPNKTIDCLPPSCCRNCKVTKFYKHGSYAKIVYDLQFGRSSIKRWIVKYRSHRYRCFQCKAIFWSQQWLTIKGRIGPQLLSYMIYQVIELRLPQRVVGLSLKQLFGLDLSLALLGQLKAKAARIYKPTYDAIFSRLTTGHVLHADETRISVVGGSAYVWVFTNLEEVAFYFTETREGEVLQTLFGTFRGVLVSDFYTAYDSMKCPQQKCLIHLIRDLNEDFLKQPFDKELEEVMRTFSSVLRPIIETVDRFGLKTRFLRRHKRAVEQFYLRVADSDYQSEAAIKYKKRFEKNRDKLFTFLDYDGVPWNNNNAEHAIKSFAMLRNVIRGSSSARGIRDYATLLSICETCKYKGTNFLNFLRSGHEDVDEFIKSNSIHRAVRL